jgi:glycosyltransferase involved in cell wall biosynthesis
MCKQLAIQLGINNRIIFTGPLHNINQVLNETDIFVLPSSFEAFPRSIIEAMAAGLPVIATDVGGNSEAVENNVSGLIVPPEDPITLAGKIQLLVQNSNLRSKMGIEARNRAEKHFSISENVNKIEGVYREILGKI